MPNSRHRAAIVSPSLSPITNRIRSSITELSFHGILLSAPFGPKSVTHVSGTFCYLCLGTDTLSSLDGFRQDPFARFKRPLFLQPCLTFAAPDVHHAASG